MAEQRTEFEQQVPTYLSGRLWRHLLRSRLESQPQHTTLEAWLKSFCLDKLEILASFPEIKQTYALFPFTKLCDLAFQQFTQIIQRREVSWGRELEAYLARWQGYHQRLQTELESLQALIDRLCSTRIQNTSLAVLLQNYDDDVFLSARPFTEHRAFQSFLSQAQAEHYTLVLEYWQKVQALETFLTDIVLVTDAFSQRSIKDRLQFLLDNPYRAFFLSGPALLLFLSQSTKTIQALLESTQSQLVMPWQLLSHLTPVEWNAIIEYGIGMQRYKLEECLAQLSANFLAVFPFTVALQQAKQDLCFTKALLSIPEWFAQLSDEDFEWVIIKISCDEQAYSSLFSPSIAIQCNSILVRFATIFNDAAKRNSFFSRNEWNFKTAIFRNWFREINFLVLLNSDAFKAYFIQIGKVEFTELMHPPSAFLQRLLTCSTEELISCCEQNATRTYTFTAAFLGHSGLVEKLNTDDALLRVLKLYQYRRGIFDDIRKASPALDRRFTGRLLIKILETINSSLDEFDNPDELSTRLSTADKVEYVKWKDSGKTTEHFLTDPQIVAQLETDYLKSRVKHINDSNAQACIRAELSRRPDANSITLPAQLDTDFSLLTASPLVQPTPSLYPSISRTVSPPQINSTQTAQPTSHSAQTASPTALSSSRFTFLVPPPSGKPPAQDNEPTYTPLSVAPMPEPVMNGHAYPPAQTGCPTFWLVFERMCKVMVIGFTAGLITAVLLPLPLPAIIGLACALGAALLGCLICMTRYASSPEARYSRSNALSAFFLPGGEPNHTKPNIRYTPLPEHEALCCS